MFHPLSPGHAELREASLAAAIVLRKCSFTLAVPLPELRDCRLLMREQAFKWRRSAILFR